MSDEPAVIETESPESAPVESSVSNEPTSTTTTEQAAPEPSVWDSFKGLPQFEGKDEADIARSLYQSLEREKAATRQLQQYQQLIPYAQEYLQNREPFEQWRNQQNAPQQAPVQPAPEPQQEQQAPPWAPTEIKPEHRRYLVRDESGRQVVAESAPIDARYALENYLNERAEFAQKFLDNPEEALGPMIQQMAERQAQELIQAELNSRDEQTYVSTLEKDNADWLYEEDGKTPTAEGLAMQKYIEQAASLGINGVEPRWEYATAMVERDLLERMRTENHEAQQRQSFESSLPAAAPEAPVPMQEEAPAPAAPAQNSAEQDIEFLRKAASRSPSRGAGQSGGAAQGGGGQTFEERLKQQLQRDNLI